MNTTEPHTYNGWRNYETWATKLWLDNDEGSYTYWRDETRRAIRHAADKGSAIYALADTLKSEHEEAMPEVDGVFADLLNAAFGEIDWYEIAEALVNDYADDDDFTDESEEE